MATRFDGTPKWSWIGWKVQEEIATEWGDLANGPAPRNSLKVRAQAEKIHAMIEDSLTHLVGSDAFRMREPADTLKFITVEMILSPDPVVRRFMREVFPEGPVAHSTEECFSE